MNTDKLFAFLGQLELPSKDWVVFGGACLAAHGIRPSKDIDLFVKPSLYKALKELGWEERITNSTKSPYLVKVINDIEVQAFINCGDETWVPQVEAYFSQPEVINGFAFMPLSEMYAWKDATRRPKDVADLELINAYWTTAS